MRIHKIVNFKGANSTVRAKALIDTGASVTLIPIGLANIIGAWPIGQSTMIQGVNDKIGRRLPIGVAQIFFPCLDNKGGKFFVVVSDIEKGPIIGMDILTPLGISINTRTHELSIKDERWEAFKTITASGVIIIGGLKVLEALQKWCRKNLSGTVR